MTAISDLEIFARVARTRNMSAAGREMNLSPAVVSKRISILEERLNTRLFERTTRQLMLTELGEGYFRRVVDVLGLVEEAEDFVNRNSRPRGILKVTAPTSFSRLHIAPYLPRFLELYPDIELEFQLTDNFVDLIRDGYHLAIRIGELQDSSLVQRKLAADARLICAAPSYIEKHGAPAALAELGGHNCLSAGAQDYWRLDGPEGPVQIRPKSNLRSNSSDFVRGGLLAGLGLGLRSIWEIGQELRCGELVQVLPQYRGASALAIHAVYPSRAFVPEKINVFIEFLARTYGTRGFWDVSSRPDCGCPARRISPSIASVGQQPPVERHSRRRD